MTENHHRHSVTFLELIRSFTFRGVIFRQQRLPDGLTCGSTYTRRHFTAKVQWSRSVLSSSLPLPKQKPLVSGVEVFGILEKACCFNECVTGLTSVLSVAPAQW